MSILKNTSSGNHNIESVCPIVSSVLVRYVLVVPLDFILIKDSVLIHVRLKSILVPLSNTTIEDMSKIYVFGRALSVKSTTILFKMAVAPNAPLLSLPLSLRLITKTDLLSLAFSHALNSTPKQRVSAAFPAQINV